MICPNRSQSELLANNQTYALKQKYFEFRINRCLNKTDRWNPPGAQNSNLNKDAGNEKSIDKTASKDKTPTDIKAGKNGTSTNNTTDAVMANGEQYLSN